MNIGRAVRAGRVKKKKRTVQDRTGQEKSHKRVFVSPIWGEALTEAIYIKNCIVVHF